MRTPIQQLAPSFTSARAYRDWKNADPLVTAEEVKEAAAPGLDIFTATMIAEGADGFIEASADQYIEAWQLLIDTGICWTLQGWFGRTAMRMISEGHCHE